MDNIHHAEMTHLVRREKELERKFEEMRDEYQEWEERIELAQKADRPELVDKAKQRVEKLRIESRQIRSELREIADKKKELRKESKMPTGEETRRAQALLESFRQSGLVDPDEAQLEQEIEDAAGDDAELEALKAKAGMLDEDNEEPTSGDRPDAAADAGAESQDDDDLDAELQALRDKMGADDAGGGDDIDLGDLEDELSDGD